MQRSLLSGLCACALLVSSSMSKEAPVVSGPVLPGPVLPGPGGVYDAVVDLVDALDRGDTEYFEKAFTKSRHGLDFYHKKDGKLSTRESEGPFDFYDVAWDGTPKSARSLKELDAYAKTLDRKGEGRPKTNVTAVYADCPSGNCSYAVVEFDRVWGGENLKQRVVQMRATALVKHVGGKAPHFRVFHWHAAKRH